MSVAPRILKYYPYWIKNMWKVTDLLWSLVPFSLPMIAGIYLLFLAITTSMNAINYVIGAIFIIFPLTLGLGLFFYETKKEVGESSLINDGIKGEAKILSIKQTGWNRNDLPQIKFILMITIPGEEPYQLEHKEYVNLLDVKNATEGAIIQVMVEPNNPKNILLLLS